ncbi:MAG TPA: 7-carboxy-7-deazaguanine synthase QueE [Methanococcaceae archaeon]|uniref:7-carboxy-7-deazaguanine synthase n=1 Tax=Methanothermococcus okinawensis TaxID=155863 RepID=A0A832ZIE7_9EURY|nr:7-carboxy-7-deazaguanine synthase QueE [Methanococcaceae archaeon]HIP91740.1 7-carboxy-7-deazaguanine synthase QueE [Methanothermococcus okinawensis]
MISEVFSSVMGEGKYIGRRYIFIRFRGCPLNCVYCDESVKESMPPRVERIPGSGILEEYPYIERDLVEIVNRLRTPDLFAVSFTGGEPLLHHERVREYSEELRDLGYRTHLESNGIYPEKLFFFHYASIDIKLPEHFKDLDEREYRRIYKLELRSIKKLYRMGSEVYAKVVVMEESDPEVVEGVARDIGDIGDITLCIQPVTPIKDIKPVPRGKLLKMMELCGKHLGDRVMCTPQIHKYLGLL